MKRLLILFSVIFIVGTLHSSTTGEIPKNDSKKTIVLVNPGVFYLKSITYMTDNGIIPAKNIEYLAVFYTKSEVKISAAKAFVRQNNIDYIKFKEVYGDLDKNNIYKTNMCSQDFYDIFKSSDGIIFFGGWDIPPVFYGEKTELTVGIRTPNRHLFELSFLFHLLGGNQDLAYRAFLEEKPYYPVLGICLGMQTMNVATGGDMYQDIPADIYGIKYIEDILKLDPDQQHRNYNKNLYPLDEIDNHSFHHVNITNFDLRKKWKLPLKFNPLVASSHHQAVRVLGKDMVIAATSMDSKVVEALVHKKFPNVIGVQFHPEFYTLHDPDSKKIKFYPMEKELVTEHEILIKNKSYRFHLNFWASFIDSVVNKL